MLVAIESLLLRCEIPEVKEKLEMAQSQYVQKKDGLAILYLTQAIHKLLDRLPKKA